MLLHPMLHLQQCLQLKLPGLEFWAPWTLERMKHGEKPTPIFEGRKVSMTPWDWIGLVDVGGIGLVKARSCNHCRFFGT